MHGPVNVKPNCRIVFRIPYGFHVNVHSFIQGFIRDIVVQGRPSIHLWCQCALLASTSKVMMPNSVGFRQVWDAEKFRRWSSSVIKLRYNTILYSNIKLSIRNSLLEMQRGKQMKSACTTVFCPSVWKAASSFTSEGSSPHFSAHFVTDSF